MSKKRITAIIINLFLILATLIFIFGNSLKNIEQSTNDSQNVTQIIEKIPPIQIAIEKEIISASSIEGNIRSFAHFFEFALLGAEIMMLIILLRSSCHIKYYLFVVLLCFIIGITDELVQSLTDRATEAIDVVKDTSGGVFGSFVVYIIYLHKKHKKNKFHI